MRWLITGAGRGLGAALAGALAERGEEVIGTLRDPGQAGALAARGVRVERLALGEPGAVESLAGRLAGQPLDVLVNNAGVMPRRTQLEGVRPEDLRAAFEINAIAPLALVQALLANLRAGRARRIVQITSRMGSIADNTSGGQYAYRASKAALNMLHRSLSLDLGPEGFLCVLLHPGWVRTDMGGAGAPLSVEESSARLLALLDRLEARDHGRFFGPEGEELPW